MTGDELTIRPYEPRDADAVVAVHEAAFQASGIEFDPDGAIDEELRNVTETYLAGDDTFLVGTLDAEVVATGGYRVGAGDPEGGEGTASAVLGHLRVRPDVQRRGFARAIMAALEGRARHDGVDRFVLQTHEDLVAAQNFYEASGYSVTKRVPHEATGDEMIHYAKKL